MKQEEYVAVLQAIATATTDNGRGEYIAYSGEVLKQIAITALDAANKPGENKRGVHDQALNTSNAPRP